MSERPKHYEKSPLGPKPNFEDAEELAERELKLPYTEIGRYPDMLRDFTVITSALNDKRRKFNLTQIDSDPSSVRLISRDIFDSDPHLNHEGTASAFYNPLTEVCFISFDEQEFLESRSRKLGKIYLMAHELSHKSMDEYGIQQYSLNLNEGIADLLAKEVLEERILPHYLKKEDERSKQEYIEVMLPTTMGIPLASDDLILEEDAIRPAAYGRIPQMYVLRQIKTHSPKAYDLLICQAIKGRPDDARRTMEETFGDEIADAVATKDVDLKALGDSILATKQRSK
jgi:hypothetical protein